MHTCDASQLFRSGVNGLCTKIQSNMKIWEIEQLTSSTVKVVLSIFAPQLC